ncbi:MULTISPECIES: hypothetical protein [unclassified Microcoleus]|nr:MULTISPECIES: hypothetical protein [unclassified Microcoleus]
MRTSVRFPAVVRRTYTRQLLRFVVRTSVRFPAVVRRTYTRQLFLLW